MSLDYVSPAVAAMFAVATFDSISKKKNSEIWI